jgi:hypothetical protein
VKHQGPRKQPSACFVGRRTPLSAVDPPVDLLAFCARLAGRERRGAPWAAIGGSAPPFTQSSSTPLGAIDIGKRRVDVAVGWRSLKAIDFPSAKLAMHEDGPSTAQPPYSVTSEDSRHIPSRGCEKWELRPRPPSYTSAAEAV